MRANKKNNYKQVGDADSDILQLDNVTVTMALKSYNNIILGNRDCPRPTTNPL
jgi:hypothetical protein